LSPLPARRYNPACPSPEVRPHPREVRTLLRRGSSSRSSRRSTASRPTAPASTGACTATAGPNATTSKASSIATIVGAHQRPALLEAELGRLGKRGIVSIAPGITDAYQPLEARLGLTRRCPRRSPTTAGCSRAHPRAPSPSATMDLWAAVNESRRLRAAYLAGVRRREPARSSSRALRAVGERLAMLADFRRRGCAVGCWPCPSCPSSPTPTSRSLPCSRCCGRCRRLRHPQEGPRCAPAAEGAVLETLSRHRGDLLPRYRAVRGEPRLRRARAAYGRDLQRPARGCWPTAACRRSCPTRLPRPPGALRRAARAAAAHDRHLPHSGRGGGPSCASSTPVRRVADAPQGGVRPQAQPAPRPAGRRAAGPLRLTRAGHRCWPTSGWLRSCGKWC